MSLLTKTRSMLIWIALAGALAATAQTSEPSASGPRKGDIALEAAAAKIEGATPIYVDSADCIGCWGSSKSKVKWTLDAPESGKFNIVVVCSHGHGPSEYVVTVGEQSLTGKIAETGSEPDWFADVEDVLGEVELAKGQKYEVAVRVTSMPKGSPFNIRRIVLRPAGPLQPLLYPNVDLTYREVGGEALKLDLAQPDGDGPFPAILCIHGGGWEGGNRKQYGKLIRDLAGRGYVGATVSYRVAPANKYPAATDDVKAALQWLRDNAAKYKIDSKRIGVMGDSAGGHLAGFLAATCGKEGIQAAVTWYGIFDFPVYWKESLSGQPKAEAEFARRIMVQFLGGSPEEFAPLYKEASPSSYVSKDDPPMLLIHGSKDTVVNVEQSELFQAKLKEAGCEAEVMKLEGGLHGFRGKQFGQAREAMFAFFDKHLKVK